MSNIKTHTEKIKELARELHDKAGEQDSVNSLYNDIVRCCNEIEKALNLKVFAPVPVGTIVFCRYTINDSDKVTSHSKFWHISEPIDNTKTIMKWINTEIPKTCTVTDFKIIYPQSPNL